jgi:hypothetical protein
VFARSEPETPFYSQNSLFQFSSPLRAQTLQQTGGRAVLVQIGSSEFHNSLVPTRNAGL